MTHIIITQDQIESLAHYAYENKGNWYKAANHQKSSTGLRIKSDILEQGFRESGIDLFAVIEPFKEGVTTAKIDLEDTNPVATIGDKHELAFAVSAVLGLLGNKDITDQFNKTVVVAGVSSGIFSISRDLSFSHRDDGVVDRSGPKPKFSRQPA